MANKVPDGCVLVWVEPENVAWRDRSGNTGEKHRAGYWAVVPDGF